MSDVEDFDMAASSQTTADGAAAPPSSAKQPMRFVDVDFRRERQYGNGVIFTFHDWQVAEHKRNIRSATATGRGGAAKRAKEMRDLAKKWRSSYTPQHPDFAVEVELPSPAEWRAWVQQKHVQAELTEEEQNEVATKLADSDQALIQWFGGMIKSALDSAVARESSVPPSSQASASEPPPARKRVLGELPRLLCACLLQGEHRVGVARLLWVELKWAEEDRLHYGRVFCYGVVDTLSEEEITELVHGGNQATSQTLYSLSDVLKAIAIFEPVEGAKKEKLVFNSAFWSSFVANDSAATKSRVDAYNRLLRICGNRELAGAMVKGLNNSRFYAEFMEKPSRLDNVFQAQGGSSAAEGLNTLTAFWSVFEVAAERLVAAEKVPRLRKDQEALNEHILSDLANSSFGIKLSTFDYKTREFKMDAQTFLDSASECVADDSMGKWLWGSSLSKTSEGYVAPAQRGGRAAKWLSAVGKEIMADPKLVARLELAIKSGWFLRFAFPVDRATRTTLPVDTKKVFDTVKLSFCFVDVAGFASWWSKVWPAYMSKVVGPLIWLFMSPKCDNAEIGSANFEAINNNRSLFNFKPKKSASGAKDDAKDDDDSGEQQEQQPQKTVKRKKGKSTAGEGVVSDEAKKALQKLSDPDVVFHNAQSLLERIELLGLHDEIKLFLITVIKVHDPSLLQYTAARFPNVKIREADRTPRGAIWSSVLARPIVKTLELFAKEGKTGSVKQIENWLKEGATKISAHSTTTTADIVADFADVLISSTTGQTLIASLVNICAKNDPAHDCGDEEYKEIAVALFTKTREVVGRKLKAKEEVAKQELLEENDTAGGTGDGELKKAAAAKVKALQQALRKFSYMHSPENLAHIVNDPSRKFALAKIEPYKEADEVEHEKKQEQLKNAIASAAKPAAAKAKSPAKKPAPAAAKAVKKKKAEEVEPAPEEENDKEESSEEESSDEGEEDYEDEDETPQKRQTRSARKVRADVRALLDDEAEEGDASEEEAPEVEATPKPRKRARATGGGKEKEKESKRAKNNA